MNNKTEYFRKYRKRNKEKLESNREDWLRKNPDYQKEYKKKNAVKVAKWNKTYREKHKESISIYKSKWLKLDRAKNPEKHATKKRLYKTRIKENIAGRQKPSQCEICDKAGTICFDHDHNTGKFRGWICSQCNIGLGLVKDKKEILLKMIQYLAQ